MVREGLGRAQVADLNMNIQRGKIDNMGLTIWWESMERDEANIIFNEACKCRRYLP